MERWAEELARGRLDAAWDLCITRYRRLILAAIRHYAQDYDEILDVFAWVCEALREDDLRRLRAYAELTEHRARFSTWLVAVVHNLTIDWFRHRDGRRRLSSAAEALPPLQRRLFELIFLDQRSHIEAYEMVRARDAPDLSFRQFLTELRNTYRAAAKGRRGVALRTLGPIPCSGEDLEEGPELDEETRKLVMKAMDALPAGDQVAIRLYIIDELPGAETARILGLPNAKAVYNRVYRALAVLKERLAAAGVRGVGP